MRRRCRPTRHGSTCFARSSGYVCAIGSYYGWPTLKAPIITRSRTYSTSLKLALECCRRGPATAAQSQRLTSTILLIAVCWVTAFGYLITPLQTLTLILDATPLWDRPSLRGALGNSRRRRQLQ